MKLLLFYTDPGSGIMLLQVLLAFFAGGLFYFRHLVKSVFGFNRGGSGGFEDAPSEPKDDESKA